MTDALRDAMLHHVRYEIAHCMIIPKWRDDAPMLKEAIFLSFFVHARNLIHFFERARTKEDDDVYASDFGFPRETLPIAPEDRTRFGKDMMHITSKRERHTSHSKPWPIRATYTAIKPVATRFSRHVVEQHASRLPDLERVAWQNLASLLEGSGDQIIVTEEEPNHSPQHNAGSRPSSGDSPAPEPRSAPAPRG